MADDVLYRDPQGGIVMGPGYRRLPPPFRGTLACQTRNEVLVYGIRSIGTELQDSCSSWPRSAVGSLIGCRFVLVISWLHRSPCFEYVCFVTVTMTFYFYLLQPCEHRQIL